MNDFCFVLLPSPRVPPAPASPSSCLFLSAVLPHLCDKTMHIFHITQGWTTSLTFLLRSSSSAIGGGVGSGAGFTCKAGKTIGKFPFIQSWRTSSFLCYNLTSAGGRDSGAGGGGGVLYLSSISSRLKWQRVQFFYYSRLDEFAYFVTHSFVLLPGVHIHCSYPWLFILTPCSTQFVVYAVRSYLHYHPITLTLTLDNVITLVTFPFAYNNMESWRKNY